MNLKSTLLSPLVDLKYNEISLTFTAGPVCMYIGVVLGLSVRLFRYPM